MFIGGVIVALGDGLLGEVNVFVGEGVVDVRHGVDGAAVEVKAGAVDVFRGGGIVQDGERVEGVVEVVVVEDDAGLDAGLSEGGAEVFLDEDGLLGLEHEHAGGVLFVERLVLDGEGVDGDAFGLHGLNVFREIGGVAAKYSGLRTPPRAMPLVFIQRGADQGWRGPDVGFDGEDLLHDGDDIGASGSMLNFAMSVSV